MTPKFVVVILLIIGIGVFSYSLVLPYYKNQKAADNLIRRSYYMDNDMDKISYYKKIAELRTNKITFMDFGAGLAIAAATILFFLTITNVKTFSDFKNINTPNKDSVLTFSNVAWFMLLPGTYWYYDFRNVRGDYPPFADSIGIPMMAQTTSFLVLFIPLNMFLFFTTRDIVLPVKVLTKSNAYNKVAILWEVFFGFWLLINIFTLYFFVIDGDHFSIPVNLFFTFILLTLRAGQISKWNMIQDKS
jgi:hypothetical protein